MNPLYKAEDVAGLLGVNKETVYRLVREDEIPYVRFGRSVRFRPASIEQWLQEIEKTP